MKKINQKSSKEIGFVLKKQKETKGRKSIITEFHIFVKKGEKLPENSTYLVNRPDEATVRKFSRKNKGYSYKGSLYHFDSPLCIETLDDEDDDFATDLMISFYISRLLSKGFSEITTK